MQELFRTRRRVEWIDTDAAGIAHFTAFLKYMEQAEHAFLRDRGLSVLMRDDEGPLSWPRVSVRCDYHQAVAFEDELDIEVSIDRLGTKSITYGFNFFHDDDDIAVGSITAVCCRIASGDGQRAVPQSIELPAWFVEKLPDGLAS